MIKSESIMPAPTRRACWRLLPCHDRSVTGSGAGAGAGKLGVIQ
jgi:hypothetical protein